MLYKLAFSGSDASFNPQTYAEQNHLHGQRREFRIRNNAQKTKKDEVKTIIFSLAYLTPIKLSFCMREGERFFIKKNK